MRRLWRVARHQRADEHPDKRVDQAGGGSSSQPATTTTAAHLVVTKTGVSGDNYGNVGYGIVLKNPTGSDAINVTLQINLTKNGQILDTDSQDLTLIAAHTTYFVGGGTSVPTGAAYRRRSRCRRPSARACPPSTPSRRSAKSASCRTPSARSPRTESSPTPSIRRSRRSPPLGSLLQQQGPGRRGKPDLPHQRPGARCKRRVQRPHHHGEERHRDPRVRREQHRPVRPPDGILAPRVRPSTSPRRPTTAAETEPADNQAHHSTPPHSA